MQGKLHGFSRKLQAGVQMRMEHVMFLSHELHIYS